MDLYSVFFGNTTEMFIYSCIGYVGSILVIASMMMTKMIKLRFINTAGCIFTVVFCILTLNMPVLILNGALMIINVYHIAKYLYTKRVYEIIDVEVAGHTIKHFINKYRQRIMLENPLFFNRYPDSNYAKVIFCDDTVVGMIVGRKTDQQLELFMNFIDANYRNKSIVDLLAGTIKGDNIKKAVMTSVPEKHHKTYIKFGWTKEDDKLVCNY